MNLPASNLGKLGFIAIAGLGIAVARPSWAADTPRFPQLFVATWGIPGPTCRTDLANRFEIAPTRATANRTVMRVVEIRVLAENKVLARFNAAGRSHVETLTVGTTGSRLFRARKGRETLIYYHCG